MKIDTQCEFAARHRKLKLGLGNSLDGWDGREVGGVFRYGGTWVNLWLIHVDVWQIPTQYYKAIILQLKINNFFKGKKKIRMGPPGALSKRKARGQHGRMERQVGQMVLNECLLQFSARIGMGLHYTDITERPCAQQTHCPVGKTVKPTDIAVSSRKELHSTHI